MGATVAKVLVGPVVIHGHLRDEAFQRAQLFDLRPHRIEPKANITRNTRAITKTVKMLDSAATCRLIFTLSSYSASMA